MVNSFEKVLQGYQQFRDKYALGDESIMQTLSRDGQQPKTMVVACCDSRVDPALILQCDPGDLFVVRNVANIVPHYENDVAHHGTSAALEFGICFLHIKHLILLGHSQCGGIQALINQDDAKPNDFISHWVELIKTPEVANYTADDYAKVALQQSQKNCLTFPWIADRVGRKELFIHLWYFDIKTGQIFTYSAARNTYVALDPANMQIEANTKS